MLETKMLDCEKKTTLEPLIWIVYGQLKESLKVFIQFSNNNSSATKFKSNIRYETIHPSNPLSFGTLELRL